MKNIEIAKKLFLWNSKNLTASAELQKSELAEFFAPSFQVNANGRNYAANYDNYFEFLNQFRATIKSIDYKFHDFITNENYVVIPKTATVVRLDNSKDIFEVVLILQFNTEHKIILWHEVYTLLNSQKD